MSPRPAAGPRFTRLFAIMMALVSKGSMPISELATKFEVDEEELISDLEMAACCGLPPYTPDQLLEIVVDGDQVSANPGLGLLRPRRLTHQDALDFILMARAMLSLPAMEDHDVLAGVLEKLEGAIGEKSTALRARVETSPALTGVLGEALAKMEQVTIEYYSFSRDEMSSRTIDPVALSSIEGQWYLDAFCHLVIGPRRFRVSRIHAAQLTGEPACQGLHGLQAGVPFDNTAGTFVEPLATSPDSMVVTLLVQPGVRSVLESYPLQSIEEREGGSLMVTIYAGSQVFLERLLLQLGGHAEVVEPPELIGLGHKAAQRVLDRYISG
ncbi:MAG: WYL domain-containing protein [Actinobacteria bacterium]|nr:WYL domain-containing protein [Actinomycetota bacterium]MCL5446273.1 WYL domain-containing protein [Actinomycetota bacterium]